ncbi:MAG: MucR family transcriptional regulator [Maricaulaceae bacterium]
MENKSELIEMASDIVAAYVGNNAVTSQDLPDLIRSVYGALATVSEGGDTVAEQPPEPAVPVKKSVTPDYIICLEDGKKFKSLKRHLRTKYDLTPEEYRERWNLPRDYPMVAPNYAKARSELAKKMGLGQKARRG